VEFNDCKGGVYVNTILLRGISTPKIVFLSVNEGLVISVCPFRVGLLLWSSGAVCVCACSVALLAGRSRVLFLGATLVLTMCFASCGGAQLLSFCLYLVLARRFSCAPLV